MDFSATDDVLFEFWLGSQTLFANVDEPEPQEIIESKSHTFKTKVFKQPFTCAVCNESIWNEGRNCKVCKYACHTKCEYKVATGCSPPVNYELPSSGNPSAYSSIKLQKQGSGPKRNSMSVQTEAIPPVTPPRGMDSYIMESLDLDVDYITERIISMSFPAGGLESQYQANLRDVVQMLQRKHGNNYLFFNLSRRRHDINKLNMQVVDIGWPDHLAPPLEKLCSICKQIETWLKADSTHVVVIHCKGGRGPIGVVVSAYMGYLNFSNSTDTALDRYAMRRFLDAKTGATMHPSQQRYIEYFSGLLARSIQINNSPLFLHYVFIHGVPNFDTDGGCRPFMRVYQNMQTVHTSGVYTVTEGTTRFAIPFDQALPLKGDILVKCYHKKFRSTTRDVIFRTQFHTTAVMEYRLVFQKSDLDDACTDPRFPTFTKVEFIFSATPDKLHNSDYVRGSSFPVENSNDPLIRWDSYENFDSVIEGEDDLVDSNMNATEVNSVPHLSAPDGSLYAQVRKSNTPKIEQVNNSASTPLMNGPVQVNGPLPNGVRPRSGSPQSNLPVAAIRNMPFTSTKLGPSHKEREELDELLKGFDDLLDGIDGNESTAGNFVSVQRQISQSHKADAAKASIAPHAAPHISPTSPSRDSGYSRSSTEIENPYAEIHDKHGNKKTNVSGGEVHNPLYGEPVMRNNSNHHTNHMYHTEPSTSRLPMVNGHPMPNGEPMSNGETMANGQHLTYGQGMSNGPVDEEVQAEVQSKAFSANPGTHSPLRYNANERLANHGHGKDDNRHYRSSSPLPHIDSHVITNSSPIPENQTLPGTPTRINSYPRVHSPTSPIRAQKEIIKYVHTGPTSPANPSSPLNERRLTPNPVSPTPSETSSEGSTDNLTWLQRQQLKLKQKRDRERQSQGSTSHPLYIDTMMSNRLAGQQTPPLQSLSPRSDSYNRVNDISSQYAPPLLSPGSISNDTDYRIPANSGGLHQDTPDPRVKRQMNLHSSPPIIASHVTRQQFQQSTPNRYQPYVPPPEAHHSPPQRGMSNGGSFNDHDRVPMTSSKPDSDNQSQQAYVDPNVVSRPPRSPRKERVYSNPVNEKRMHQIEKSLHANETQSCVSPSQSSSDLTSSYTTLPTTNTLPVATHASSNPLIQPQPIYRTLNDQLIRAIPAAKKEGVVVRSTEHKVKTTVKFYPIDEYDRLVESGEIQPGSDNVEVIKYIPLKGRVEDKPDKPVPEYNWVMNRIGSLRNLNRETNHAPSNEHVSKYQSQPDLRGHLYNPTTGAVSQIPHSSFTPISNQVKLSCSDTNVGPTMNPRPLKFPKKPSHPFQHESSLGSMNDLQTAPRYNSTGHIPRTQFQSTPNLMHESKITTPHGLDLTRSLSRLDEEDPLCTEPQASIPRTAINMAKNELAVWEHALKNIGSYDSELTNDICNSEEDHYRVPRMTKVRFHSDSNLLADSFSRPPANDEADAKAGEPVHEPVIRQGTVASRVADARARIVELERSMSPPGLERNPRSIHRNNSAAGYENGVRAGRSRTPSPEVWMRNPGGQPQQETYYWNRLDGLKSPEIEAMREKERLMEYGPVFDTPPNTPGFPLEPKTPYANMVSTPLAYVGGAPEDSAAHQHHTPQSYSPQQRTPSYNASKQGTPQLGTPQLGTPQQGTPQHSAVKQETPQHGTPQVGSPQQVSPQPIPPRLDSLQRSSPQQTSLQHHSPQLYKSQENTPHQYTPHQNSPFTTPATQNTPQHIITQQEAQQQSIPQQYTSEKITPELYIKERDTQLHTPQQYTPQQSTPQQYTPQQSTPQQYTLQQSTPQQYTPQQNTPQQYTPQQSTPQQYTPQQNTPQQYSPQQNTTQQFTPQQNTPQQYSPQQNTPQQYSPQQKFPQQYTPQQNTPQQYSPQQNTPQQYTPQQNTPQQFTPQHSTPQQYSPQITEARKPEMSPIKMHAPNTHYTTYPVAPQTLPQTRSSPSALKQHSPEPKSVHFDIDDFFEPTKLITNNQNERKDSPQISPGQEKIEKSRVRFAEERSPKQDENRNERNMKDLSFSEADEMIIPTNQHQVEVQIHHSPPDQPTRVKEMPHSLPFGVETTMPYPQYTVYNGGLNTTNNGQISPSGSHDGNQVSPTAPFASVELPPRNYYPTFSDRLKTKASNKHAQHQKLPESEQSNSAQGDADMSGYRTVYDNRGKHARQPGSPASVRSASSVGESGRTTPSNFYLNEQPSLSSSQTSLAEPGVENVRFVKDLSSWWYKPNITRDDAIAMLKDKQPGTFVVRDSNSFPGAFGLAVKVATPPPNAPQQRKAGDPVSELVRHFLIEPNSRGVKLKGCVNEPIFGSLSALVYQHTMKQLALPCKLMLPESDPASGPGSTNDANSRANLLAKGAACNVLYLHSFDMESLTGSSAVCEASKRLIDLATKPPSVIVHFKVSSKGITVTDNNRRLFFRRHYPVQSVLFCGSDSGSRRWQRDEGSDEADARIFGFVSRKPGSLTDNVCHLFAEYEKEQPASAIVSFVTKVLIGQVNTSVKSP